MPFFLISGLIFAHFVGLASALVAAVTAAALALWLDRFPAWIGLASGLTALAIAGLRGSAFLPNGTEETFKPGSYTNLRAHETVLDLVCRLLLEKKNNDPNTSCHKTVRAIKTMTDIDDRHTLATTQIRSRYMTA